MTSPVGMLRPHVPVFCRAARAVQPPREPLISGVYRYRVLDRQTARGPGSFAASSAEAPQLWRRAGPGRLPRVRSAPRVYNCVLQTIWSPSCLSVFSNYQQPLGDTLISAATCKDLRFRDKTQRVKKKLQDRCLLELIWARSYCDVGRLLFLSPRAAWPSCWWKVLRPPQRARRQHGSRCVQGKSLGQKPKLTPGRFSSF